MKSFELELLKLDSLAESSGALIVILNLLQVIDSYQLDVECLFAGPVFAHVLGDAEAEPQVELFFQLHRSLRQVRAVASKGQQLRSHAVLVQVIEVKEDVFIGSVQDQKSKLL